MRAFFSTTKTQTDWPAPFWRDLHGTNLQRMRVLAKIYIGITVWFAIAQVANTYVNDQVPTALLQHIYWFAAVPVVNIGLLALLHKYKRAGDTVNVRWATALALTYLTIVQSLAGVISAITAMHYNHITAYLIALMLAAATVILPWRLSLFPATISAGACGHLWTS